MRTDPSGGREGISRMTRTLALVGLSGSLGGLLVFLSWNWGLAPLLQADPLPDLGRSIVRSVEAVAFVVVWRATR